VPGHSKLAGVHVGRQRLPGLQLVNRGAQRIGAGALGVPVRLRPFGSAFPRPSSPASRCRAVLPAAGRHRDRPPSLAHAAPAHC
jgi:hypothetical protein